MSTKRKVLLAAVVWAALAAVPPPSDADYQPMSDEQVAGLTCGHLGVPCPPPHHRSKCASASRHRKSRHTRTRHVRAHTAGCRSAKKASKRRRAAAARHRS